MKAFLLAAGMGSRLGEVTKNTPKCLVKIQRRPIAWWWLSLLHRYGISDVLINTHYLSEQVHGFVAAQHGAWDGMRIVETYEPVLLGSGGTLAAHRGFIGQDDDFLICYADVLTGMNLRRLIDYHQGNDGIMTMALFRSDQPAQCGIAECDGCGRIVRFVEKPPCPVSNLANAGVYVARRELFNYIPQDVPSDLGIDVIPKLAGKMYGLETSEYLIDIGSRDNLDRARREWQYDCI